MKKFITYTIAAFIGAGLAFFAVMFVFFLMGVALIGSSVEQSGGSSSIKDDGVLHIKASQIVPELTNNVKSSGLSFDTDDVVGFHAMLAGIQRAATSSKVKGIYLDLTTVSLGHTQIYNLADELKAFRESGKFVYAYSDVYSQHAYVVASAADSVYLHPMGKIELKGYASMQPYFKDFREKLGIDVDIYNTGDYKSAGETYLKNEMSDANRAQTRQYLNEMKESLLEEIAENRSLSTEQVDLLADGYMMTTAREAIDKGLADATAYESEVFSQMKKQLDKDKLPLISLQDWVKGKIIYKGSGDSKIALVIAEGTILDDTEDKGVISDERYVPIIDRLTRDDDVKAMVLRVNSGGGSVIASDNIYAAINRFKDAGKKVVVSMGDLAASGGYYISMNADHIIAEESTITGSIGVVSIVPNIENMLEEKLGIHFDTVKTDPLAAGFSLVQSWSDQEQEIFQRMTDEYYGFFLQKVADGRGMTVDEVQAIAQGRVWTGDQALENGLIDQIGSLNDAFVKAKELLEVEDAKVTVYPKFQAPLLELMESLQSESPTVKSSVQEMITAEIPMLQHSMDLLKAGPYQVVMLEQLVY